MYRVSNYEYISVNTNIHLFKVSQNKISNEIEFLPNKFWKKNLHEKKSIDSVRFLFKPLASEKKTSALPNIQQKKPIAK